LNTKEEIMLAAQKLFAEKGFNGTSVKDICDAAGANISAVNYHFKSKEDLFYELIRSFIAKSSDQLIQTISTPAQNLEEFKTRLQIFFETFFNYTEQNYEMVIVTLRNLHYFETVNAAETRDFYYTIVNKIGEFISYGQKQKYLDDKSDSSILAEIIFGIVNSEIEKYNHTKLKIRTSLDKEYRQKFISHAIDLVVKGMKA